MAVVAFIFLIMMILMFTCITYHLIDGYFDITTKWFTPYINSEEYNLFDNAAHGQIRREINYHMNFSDTNRDDLLSALDKLTALRPRIDSLKSECKKSYYAWDKNYYYLKTRIKRRLKNLPDHPHPLPEEREISPVMNMRKG